MIRADPTTRQRQCLELLFTTALLFTSSSSSALLLLLPFLKEGLFGGVPAFCVQVVHADGPTSALLVGGGETVVVGVFAFRRRHLGVVDAEGVGTAPTAVGGGAAAVVAEVPRTVPSAFVSGEGGTGTKVEYKNKFS